MKKIIIIILVLLFLSVLIYYFNSSYEIKYNVGKYKIKETYKNSKYYFEINNKKFYNFDSLDSRKVNKKQIYNISYIKDNEYECIIPRSKKLETYPLCYRENEMISFSLVKSNKIKNFFNKNGYKIKKEDKKEKKDFQFYNNLTDKDYIAVWKYNGFYIMNENNIKTINLFKNDKYDNSLGYLHDKYLLVPNYDQEHEFNSFYIINVKNGKYSKIKTNFSFSYEGYILGSYKNNVYFYDKKYETEYEINLKREKIELIGNEDKGYIKYTNNKKENARKKELNKGLTFKTKGEIPYIYKEKEKLTKTYKENKKHSLIIFDTEAKVIKTFKDKVYFMDKENLYEYTPITAEKKVIRNFEWNFNSKNTIFIYNE